MVVTKKGALSDREICTLIKDYVFDSVYPYALMIDGEWGCGKTYLIKNGISPLFDADGEMSDRKFIYISLYGLATIADLRNTINSKYLAAIMGKGAAKVTDLAVALAPAWLKTVDDVDEEIVDAVWDSAAKISSRLGKQIVPLKNCFFVFDDLERCCIPISEVFGFINQLIEHYGSKALIVANERECGLSPYGEQEPTKEEMVYLRTKEKLIGRTIRYQALIDDAVPKIVCEAMKTILANDNVCKLACDVSVKAMKDEESQNLRSLQYALSGFAQIFDTIMNIPMIEPVRKKVLGAVMNAMLRVSIRFRRGKNTRREDFEWKNRALYGMVTCEGPIDDIVEAREYERRMKSAFLSFNFIHSYILTGWMDKKVAKMVLSAYARILEDEYKLERDPYGLLQRGYWHLDEVQMKAAISELEKRFLANKYEDRLCLQVINISLQYYDAFEVGNPKILCDHLLKEIEAGKKRIELEYDAINRNDNSNVQWMYEDLLCRIEMMNAQQNLSELAEKLNCFGMDEWGRQYHHICAHERMRQEYIDVHRFASLIDLDSLVHAVEKGTASDTVCLAKAFQFVYEKRNEFVPDMDALGQLIIKLEELQIEDCVKKRVVKSFVDELKDIHSDIVEFDGQRRREMRDLIE